MVIGPVYRFALIGAAILVVIVFAMTYQGGGGAGTGQAVLALLVLSALPLIAFWAAPGKIWVRALLFALTLVAVIAATVALLGVGDAWPVIRRWLWLLACVGGGLLFWRLKGDR